MENFYILTAKYLKHPEALPKVRMSFIAPLWACREKCSSKRTFLFYNTSAKCGRKLRVSPQSAYPSWNCSIFWMGNGFMMDDMQGKIRRCVHDLSHFNKRNIVAY